MNRSPLGSEDVDALVAVLVGQVDPCPGCDAPASGQVEEDEVGIFGGYLFGAGYPPPFSANDLLKGLLILGSEPFLLGCRVEEGEFLL